MANYKREQVFRFGPRLQQILSEPLGNVPAYYRRVNSKNAIDNANFEVASTILGWFEMFHGYSSSKNAKEEVKEMHRHANNVFSDSDKEEKQFTLSFNFECDPKRVSVTTTRKFNFKDCCTVSITPSLDTECETKIGDMVLILDSVAGELEELAKREGCNLLIEGLRFGFHIEEEETQFALELEISDTIKERLDEFDEDNLLGLYIEALDESMDISE